MLTRRGPEGLPGKVDPPGPEVLGVLAPTEVSGLDAGLCGSAGDAGGGQLTHLGQLVGDDEPLPHRHRLPGRQRLQQHLLFDLQGAGGAKVSVDIHGMTDIMKSR